MIDRGRLDDLLTPWIAEPAERAFVVRCIAAEGPIHHRGASYVLLALLGEALAAAPARDRDPGAAAREEPTAPVPLRLPPHLQDHARGEREYPLRLPLQPLQRLAGAGAGADAAVAAMADALVDGPPHHALANAAMVCLLGELLARLQGPA